MKRTMISFAIVTATVAAAAISLSAETKRDAAASGGAPEVEAAWLKAMRAGDVDALVACYAPDATLWVPDQPEADGAEAIRASYAGLLGANTVIAVSTSNEKHRTVGSVGAGWGRWTMTLQPKSGGAPTTMHGRFTEVVERRNGKWVYVADHASEDPPPTDAPAH